MVKILMEMFEIRRLFFLFFYFTVGFTNVDNVKVCRRHRMMETGYFVFPLLFRRISTVLIHYENIH